MTVKLMVLDVDGTLTDEEGKISQENTSAVRAALAAGTKVILATGRPLHGVEKICRELGLNGPLILTNGSLVLQGDQIWFEDYLHNQDLNSIFEYGLAFRTLAILAVQPEIIKYWFPTSIDASWISGLLDSYSLHRRMKVKSPYDLPLERINKVMYIGNESAAAEALNTWPEKLAHLVRGRSYPHIVEINSDNANKGKALSIVCDRLGISPDEVLAIGDGETDLPMLRMSGKAVFIARGSKIPCLPEHAVIVSKDKCNCGVAWAVANYININK